MKKHITALLIFTILTIALTFPLILKINKYCATFSSTDELLAAIWSYWQMKYAWLHGLDITTTDFLAYPYGIKVMGIISYPYFGFVGLLLVFLNPISTLNVQVFLNFILSGYFTYLLVFKLTKSWPCGIISGIIFTFCPQHFVRSWQHITLSYFQWMPLYILSLFNLKDKQGLANIFLCSLSLFLVASFDLHYFFFMSFATLIFIALFLASGLKRKPVNFKFIKSLFLGLCLAGVLTLAQFYSYFSKIGLSKPGVASAQNIFKRPFEDLFMQSAKPLSYLLPSTEHPLFGNITKIFIGTPLYGESLTEHNLYLGIVAIILAIFGWKLYKKNKRGPSSGGEETENFALKFFLSLSLFSWYASQPPWYNFFGVKIYNLSFFTYKILPMIRAYCRFGIVLTLAIAVLAGFGLKYLLDKQKSILKKRLIFAVFCGLILFDFWNNPFSHLTDLSGYNQAYDWLKDKKGDFIIAEYPLDLGGSNDFYKFFQTIHEKKMINCTIPNTCANAFSRSITQLSIPKTTIILKSMGVKYVLVHKQDYLDTGLISNIEEANRIPENKELKFIRSFPARDCVHKIIRCLGESGQIDIYEMKFHGP